MKERKQRSKEDIRIAPGKKPGSADWRCERSGQEEDGRELVGKSVGGGASCFKNRQQSLELLTRSSLKKLVTLTSILGPTPDAPFQVRVSCMMSQGPGINIINVGTQVYRAQKSESTFGSALGMIGPRSITV